MMELFLQEHVWPILVLLGTGVVWGIRLEGMVKAINQDIIANYPKRAELATLQGQVSSAENALATLTRTVDRIEGKIDRVLEERRHGQ